jgi:hypothetical protein
MGLAYLIEAGKEFIGCICALPNFQWKERRKFDFFHRESALQIGIVFLF